MLPKLLSNFLRPPGVSRGQLGTYAPHLLYANLDFGSPDAARRARSLLWIPGWDEPRALRFLQDNQNEFRRCLDWLSNGSVKDIEIVDDPSVGDSGKLKAWEEEPEVEFLRRHGLEHGRALFEPANQDGSFFAGITLTKDEPEDPLDPICWYVLSLLAWDGTTGVRRCGYYKCGVFFRPRTRRKAFCSDLCRSKNGAAHKTSKEKNEYMRLYRKSPYRAARALKKTV
jgi:hypothetical protein